MKVILKAHNGYTWVHNERVFFRGYIQFETGEVHKGYSAIELIDRIESFQSFCNFLSQCYGSFSIIVKREDSLWAAVDISRSMPLYYSEDGCFISDDAELVRKSLNIERESVDSLRILEIYESSFVAHENTVYKNIFQLEMGDCVEFSDKPINIYHYFRHYSEHRTVKNISFFELLEQKKANMIDRLIKAVAGRKIVLSLSGGYDSRFLACSLKEAGIDDVVCYTYGRKDSYEVIQAREVAEALNFKWYCIEYSDKEISDILFEKDFWEYSNSHDYSIYLQNYLAVKYMHVNKIIPKESVFVTGLCNDMPTGAYIPSESVAQNYGFDSRGVAYYIVAERFVRFPLNDSTKELFIRQIEDRLCELQISVYDYESFVEALDSVLTGYSHSRCFLNMNKAHDFWGYEWLLPCWDKEWLSFWYSLPNDERINQRLYEDYIIGYIGKKYGVGKKKQINQISKSDWVSKIKRKVGGLLVCILYPLGIPIKRNTDINNFAPLEVQLYKQISQKGAIAPERAAIILLLNIYVLENRYGTNWYDSIKSYLV